MKRALIFLCIMIFSFPVFLEGQIEEGTLTEQLHSLNKSWKDKANPFSIDASPFNNEVQLIQTHLSLVEENLRSVNTQNLSPEQLAKRTECLDILQKYWAAGVFPQNLYHKERTPYFIDHLGTACAVGQLLVETGHEDFAKAIAKTNNYVYISDLDKENPGLKKWADSYGFTVAELAWIQPTYAICDTTCNQSLFIVAYGGTPPYTYLWSNGSTTEEATDLCPGETYSCLVLDALEEEVTNVEIYFQASVSMENTVTIPAAEPLFLEYTSTKDCDCDGTATAIVTSGYAPYQYYWEDGQNTETAIGLCSGEYIVTVFDNIGCVKEELVIVSPELDIQFSMTGDDGNCIGTATAMITGGTSPYTYAWDADNQNTATATGLCLGDYNVTITDANGCVNTNSVSVGMLSSAQEPYVSDLLVYPNPAKGEIAIQLISRKTKTNILSIHDMTGQLIFQEKLSSDLLEVDLTSFENGVYFITVDDGGRRWRKKIVKMD